VTLAAQDAARRAGGAETRRRRHIIEFAKRR
jgi:hypothetical protein